MQKIRKAGLVKNVLVLTENASHSRKSQRTNLELEVSSTGEHDSATNGLEWEKDRFYIYSG